MALIDIVSLLRRHIAAVAVVLAIAATAGYWVRTAPPSYVETGSVVFTVTRHLAGLARTPRQNGTLSQSLIATEATVAQALSPGGTPAGLRTADGPAQFTLVPFNSYDLEYPNYSLPSATLTVTSPSAAATRRAFRAVFTLVARGMTARQRQAGVPADGRVRVYVAADTGAQLKPGSHARVLAGMAVLALVALLTVTGWLDRRRRPAGRRRAARVTGGRRRPVTP
jgi:hypothetical protein